MKKFFTILILLTACIGAAAQSTRVKGRVTDAGDGSGVSFAGVYFKGTTIGVSTDIDGYYSIDTRDPGTDILCVMILGYEQQERQVNLGAYNEVDFSIRALNEELKGAVVKPDNRYMNWILDQINANKERNDPERGGDFSCDSYTKSELDLSNAEDQIKNKLLRKNFGFVFDYMDTSVVSGKPYLPVMISETVSRYSHTSDPSREKEEIKATKISGIENNYSLSQFAGSMHVKPNLYRNYLEIFNVSIPSPLAESGRLYYNYYLIDSLNVDGRKTYKIRFHPKALVSSPVFDGELSIDSKDFALREAHVKMQKGSNVNWIRDLVIDVENQLVGDSLWFYKMEKMYADFSVQMRDSARMISFLGNREVHYSNPTFGGTDASVEDGDARVSINKDVLKRDDAYWAEARPYELSDKEKGIYQMVEQVKNVPVYKSIYDVMNMLFTGYIDGKYVGFGPVIKLVSFNNLEGLRTQFGLRTTKGFSRTWRLSGYVAYGFRDEAFKGGWTTEYVFNTIPTRKFTASFTRDVFQLGKGEGAFSESNLMNSLLAKGGGGKRSPVNEYALKYEHEFSDGFNAAFGIESWRIFSNAYVPMVKPDGTSIGSVGTNQAKVTLRFSREETVQRGDFVKSYLFSDYPVVTLNMVGAVKGFGHNECTYFSTEVGMRYRKHLPPLGTSHFEMKAGKVFGQVPYPFLKLHEGNGTYFLDKTAFACMDYYEFASDTWATFAWEHEFKGFFFGKVPLLRRMQLRENFTLKAAYGTLSKKNDGRLSEYALATRAGKPDESVYGDKAESAGLEQDPSKAMLLFPEGMGSLNKPYVEMGVGVSNILRVFRVDFFWRMTHRTREVGGVVEKVPNRFALNFGVELKF